MLGHGGLPQGHFSIAVVGHDCLEARSTDFLCYGMLFTVLKLRLAPLRYCTEPARKPLQAASKQQAAAVSKKASAKAAKDTKMKGGDSDMENAETDKTEPEAATKAVESAKGDAQGSHSEYGAPPHPDAEIAMIGSKVVWQFINDKGEEVTVVSSLPTGCVQCCCCCSV